MKYQQPYDQPSAPNAPYLDLDAAHGVDGSIPPAAFFNGLQAELLDLITYSGLTPNGADLTQVRQAILALLPSVSGAPSDASLVHYGVDSGVANALDLAVTPGITAVTQGCMIFFYPNADGTSAATVKINLISGNVTKALVGPDGAPIGTGDVRAGVLSCMVFVGTAFRLFTVGASGRTSAFSATTPGAHSTAVPTWAKRMRYRLWAGGGAGGNGNNGGAGSGGSGGEYREGVLQVKVGGAVAPGDTLNMTVGAGGAVNVVSGGNGGNGGLSSITGVATAAGGLGGLGTVIPYDYKPSVAGGTGGSGGDLAIPGGSSGPGGGFWNGIGGPSFGFAAPGGQFVYGGQSAGIAGNPFGCGGSASAAAPGAYPLGGAGAPGRIDIWFEG